MWNFLRGKETKGPPERQPRAAVEIPVNFRRVSEYAWNIGKTSNMSKSGVLLRSVQPLGPSTTVELEFVAPPLFGDDAGQLVACRGKIVRILPPPPNDRRASMAVHFSRFEVVRRPGEW
jgi:PilZ domain-containing protein